MTYSMRIGIIVTAIGALAGGAAAQKLQMKDLPPAVQKTVQDEAKGAEIKGLSKETEHGKTEYEVETIVNGKHRDFNVDTKGNVTVVEVESSLDGIPAGARSAIEKKAAGGKIRTVEIMTRGSETLYEAGYTSKDGKRHSVLVKADGTETKE